MIYVKDAQSGAPLYDALNSSVRINILKLLRECKEANMNQLARSLGLSNGAVTGHVKKLQDAGLIEVLSRSGVRGSQKICKLTTDKVIIDLFGTESGRKNIYIFDIGIGHYIDYKISPTCGIVTGETMIGEFDDPRYFSFPNRIDAALLWFAQGYISYQLPNSLNINECCDELQISMELASEAPGYLTNYPSDIGFRLNNTYLGYFTSPGEFNDRNGIFTPSWWPEHLGQYGKLKLLTINDSGCFIDGLQISDVTIDSLKIMPHKDLIFSIEVSPDALNKGGVNLFGKGFGDYDSGISVKMYYSIVQTGMTSQRGLD